MTASTIITRIINAAHIPPYGTGQQVRSCGRAEPESACAELSAGGDVFKAVDDFFDLSRPGRFDGVLKLDRAARNQFYKMVGSLLMNGYVGYETLIVNNKVERHDLVLQIGDDRLKQARPYRGPWHRRQ